MTALHVFIDTNIFLNFYSFPDDKLNVLDELIELTGPEGIVLHLPKQVENELKRNRESKLQLAITEFRNAKLPSGVPQHMRGTDAAKQYEEAIKSADKAKSALLASSISLALSNQLDIDKKLASLLEKSVKHAESDEIYQRALIRTQKGNPPGKPEGLGDRYIWETLLASVPEADLFIISRDSDYSSPLSLDKSVRPLSFLADEWRERKGGSKLTIFKTIGEIVSHFKNLQRQPINGEQTDSTVAPSPEIEAPYTPASPVSVPPVAPAPISVPSLPSVPPASSLPPRDEVDAAVQNLVTSDSFRTTHWAISRLQPLRHALTVNDAERLFSAILGNNQISSIRSDEDVNGFYLELITDWATQVTPDLADMVIDLFGLNDRPRDEDQLGFF